MADEIDLLIIDDDPNIIDFFMTILVDYELNIRTFNDAKKALIQLHEISPKTIFLNYSMPEMNGEQFIIKMSEKCYFRGTSIYLLTNKDLNPLEMLELQTLGFSSIIKKPLSENKIFTLLNETIDLKLKKISA